MSTIGRVSFFSSNRKIAIITPLGKSRDHDLIAHEIQFLVAGLGSPFRGQRVQFDVAAGPAGEMEATNLRTAPATAPEGIKLTSACGALPAVVLGAAAGNLSSGGQ